MLVSIIISCKNKYFSLDGLLADIASQNVSFSTEVLKSIDVSPAGKARNEGAAQVKGEILVFLDCDIRLHDQSFLANLVNPLIENNGIGITCASLRIPKNASKFQISYAQQMPHCETSIVNVLTDVMVATSACCAVKRDLFYKIGKFNQDVVRGEDSIFSHRIINAGYRAVLVPQTWCYHPQPDNFFELIKIQLRNGQGVSFVDIFYPDANIDVHPEGVIYFTKSNKSKIKRVFRLLRALTKSILRGRLLFLAAKLVYLVGYLIGFIKFRIFKGRK